MLQQNKGLVIQHPSSDSGPYLMLTESV